MNNILIFLILYSYCVNYPILFTWGYSLSLPIAIVAPTIAEGVSFLKKISAHMQVVTGGIENIAIEQPPSGGLIYPVRLIRGKVITTAIKAIEWASDSVLSIEHAPLSSAIFFVFEQVLPQEFKDTFFRIHISSSETEKIAECPILAELIPHPEQLPVVQEQIFALFSNSTHEPLVAAVSFCYPYLKSQNQLGYYNELIRCAQELSVNNSLYSQNDSVSMLFFELLEEYIHAYGYSAFIKLITISKESLDADLFYFNERYLYMSNCRFEQLMRPLLTIYASSFLKASLSEANLLLREETNTYLSKMHFRINNDIINSKKMLRFDLKMFPSKGYSSFFEELEKGGN